MLSTKNYLSVSVLAMLLTGIGANAPLDHNEWSGAMGYPPTGDPSDAYMEVSQSGPGDDTGEIFLYRNGYRVFTDYVVAQPNKTVSVTAEGVCYPGTTLYLTINGRYQDYYNC